MKKYSKLFAIIIILAIMIFMTVDLHTMAYPAEEVTVNATIQVDPDLAQLFADNGEAGYLIYFKEEADLSAAYEMDWDARGEYVVKALQETARDSQKNVQSFLNNEGVKTQSFWIDNVIIVENSSLNTFQGLMSFNEIEALVSRQMMHVIEPEGQKVNVPNSITAVEPNIDHVDAPTTWSSGIRGEGMVVANIDTGVRSTHEALVRQYRGTSSGSHDYNWLGAAGSSTTPVDDHGHGTHTMGTILGEDVSLTNQIGVAPGAQWIACDGCEGTGCPDAALLSCAQWIAAPYPVGDPGSPDPSMRPHAVNNSWGDCDQSYDNWYQGSVDAWHAAGIYPIFSNGNASNCGYSSPPGLNTVGNPARYGNVTGVGSSGESNGQYATHSNWGPTDNLDTVNPQLGFADLKPQVLAPGVSIRSSTPGSDTDYQDGWNGTSMSAPHVTGLVALIWQAAPCLTGDYAATETIIEETATPIYYDDGTGGGARWPNYATGWGEINVSAAVQQAQSVCGPTGTIVGTVTDDNTSATLADVDIVATQSVTISKVASTDINGEYAIDIAPIGDYTVTASLFGYLPAEITGVSVVSGTTTTLDIALTMAPSALITGYVTDATVGWPLYANIAVEGASLDVWTNPETGYYSLYLPQGSTYTMTASAWSTGYDTESVSVGPLTDDETVDFTLNVDTVACSAPGYIDLGLHFSEPFDSWPPAGWNIANNGGGCTWADDADDTNAGAADGPDGNLTGGTGTFADADSDECGSGTTMDTDLTSPAIDLSGIGSASLEFKYDFRHLGTQIGSVDISTNGGTNWTEIWSVSADDRGPKQATIDISAYSGSANTQLRYGFVSTGWNWWFQVDDIEVREGALCIPQAGGLVVGNVYDAGNGGVGFNGAEVTTSEGSTVTAVETPADPNVDDGFYTTFSLAGTQTLTATVSLPGYYPGVKTTNVVQSDTVRLDFALGGIPDVELSDDDAMTGIVGEDVVYSVQITNTGSLTDTFDLTAGGWPASLPGTISVAPGEMESFSVTVTIPTGQGVNITGTTTVIATSQVDSMIYDSINLVSTGTPVELYLPAILKP